MLRNVADPIAELRRAVAAFRPGQERLTVNRGAEVKRTTEPRRRSLVEGDVNDADATARADAAVLALQSASAGVDDALAEVELQLADAQLRLDPDRDQAARPAEAIKREKEAEELKQTTREFVEAGARLAEALTQVTAVSFTTSEAAAIVVRAVSEIVEETKLINRDLESYVRFVVSGSAPIRRQPIPVTLAEILATPTTLPILPPLLELPSVHSKAQRPEFFANRAGSSENMDSSLTMLLEHAEVAFDASRVASARGYPRSSNGHG